MSGRKGSSARRDRLAWFRRRDRLPDAVRAATALGAGERMMAHAPERRLALRLVATTWRLLAVTEDGEVLGQWRWLDVATGGWEPTTGTLSVIWADGTRPREWSLDDGARFADVFRERVSTSVVVGARLDEDGREYARVAIRRDIATGELVPQLVWPGGGRGVSPERRARAEEALADLAERVGLEPPVRG